MIKKLREAGYDITGKKTADRRLGESLLFGSDRELDEVTNVIMRVMDAGEYIKNNYTPAEQKMVEAYFDGAVGILEMGLSQGKTMDDMLRFIFPTSGEAGTYPCLLYTSPSPRDVEESRMPSSA